MLKKIIIALLVALPLSAAAQKFGTVDIDQVISAMPEVAEMQTQLTEASKKYEAEFQKLVEELNKLVTEFQAIQNDANTPETIKNRLKVYHSQTSPLRDYYISEGKYHAIDGSGDVQAISDAIIKSLNAKVPELADK